MSEREFYEIKQKLDVLIKVYVNPLRQLVVIFALMSTILGANVTSNHIEDVVAGVSTLSYTIILASIIWVATFVMVIIYIFKQGMPHEE
jgi:hypothetical protein